MSDDIIVSVSCLAYNHEPYIRRCLDGILMQQTNFKFEILIHDDASRDSTAEIVAEYANRYSDIIKPIYQTENQYSKRISISATYNWSRAKGKYIAMCEGDDYWTDPLKLQKQVDFLETNPEYSLVAGGFVRKNVISDETETVIHTVNDITEEINGGFDITIERWQKKWLVKTLTLLYRRDALDIDDFLKYQYKRDVHLIYLLLRSGRGFYMKEVLGVYHMHPGGIYGMADVRNKMKTRYLLYHELYTHHPEHFKFKMFYSISEILLEYKKNDERIQGIPNKFYLALRLIYFAQTNSELERAFKILGIRLILLQRLIYRLKGF